MDDTGANRNLLPREALPGVLVCPDAAEVARAAARRFVDWAWQAIARDGKFQVALSGGSTPREMYRLLATQEFRTQIDWARVHLFWGDERAVPPEHADSNYGLARRELLLRVAIPPDNVHRMEAEVTPIGRAAHSYETVLRQSLELDDRGFPVFHLVLLGLGADGHTASLFPGARLLRETSRWVSTPTMDKLGTRRMTLTLPVIEAAKRILFLVTDSQKAAMLRVVLCGRADRQLPAQMAQPRNGERIFLVDEAAARLLPAGAPAAAAPPENPKKHK
jgi:6-phosphogluconolactonase